MLQNLLAICHNRAGAMRAGVEGISELEHTRERSMALCCALDLSILAPMLLTAVWGNSLTLMGECLRGMLPLVLEFFLFAVLWHIHRRRFTSYEYGPAKLETFGNLLVGTGQLLGAVWVLTMALLRLSNPPDQPALGLAMAALVAFANLGVNAVGMHAMWRAGCDGTSILITGQLRSRFSKLVASALAALAITINAIWGEAAIVADVAGAILVFFVMATLGIGMLSEALPHLLDRGLDEARQAAINQVLARHFHAYDAFGAVRSRVAGKDAIVEITLGFAADRTIGEIQTVADAVASDIAKLIPGGRVTVTPQSLGKPG